LFTKHTLINSRNIIVYANMSTAAAVVNLGLGGTIIATLFFICLLIVWTSMSQQEGRGAGNEKPTLSLLWVTQVIVK
jgi:hypothetical protein